MAEHFDALVSSLWAACRDGKRPVRIRMAYATYCEFMKTDEEFNEEMDYDSVNQWWTFQTLPVVYDSWHKTPFIEVVNDVQSSLEGQKA